MGREELESKRGFCCLFSVSVFLFLFQLSSRTIPREGLSLSHYLFVSLCLSVSVCLCVCPSLIQLFPFVLSLYLEQREGRLPVHQVPDPGVPLKEEK